MIPVNFVFVTLVLITLAVPIVFSLGMAPVYAFVIAGKEQFLTIIPQRLYNGVSSFPLLAIPLFILAGEVMNVGGITKRLVDFSKALVGHLRGGLAHVNILSSIMFAGLSGSAVADTSALGSMLIPAMEKQGFSRAYSCAVTAASSVIGPIIPPSIIMVVYANVMQIPVASLFLAGLVPGVLTGIGLMFVAARIAKKRDYPRDHEHFSVKRVGITGLRAFFPLMTPVIILGGIVFGVFTPTEAAAIAVVYALIVSTVGLRTLRFKDCSGMLFRTSLATAGILLTVGMANVFGWAVTLSGFPKVLAEQMLAISENKFVLLLLINLFLLLIGMVLDAGPAILILGPIFTPLAAQLGIDPVHFAIIMCVNLTIGLATPPMGLILFVASTIGREKFENIVKEMLPFYTVHVAIILLITFIPAISLSLPKLVGLMK